MDDQRVLEKLLPIALDLIETDRDRADILYSIFKYLEARLEDKGDLEAAARDPEEDPGDLQGDTRGPDRQGQAVNVFHIGMLKGSDFLKAQTKKLLTGRNAKSHILDLTKIPITSRLLILLWCRRWDLNS